VTEDTEDRIDEGLVSRVRVVEAQPLETRAAAYASLHDELAHRLEQAPNAPAGA